MQRIGRDPASPYPCGVLGSSPSSAVRWSTDVAHRGAYGASMSSLQFGKGVDVADKSPRKASPKKAGKTLKEKRQVKKDKDRTRKGMGA